MKNSRKNLWKLFNKPEADQAMNPFEVKVHHLISILIPIAVISVKFMIIEIGISIFGGLDGGAALEGNRGVFDVIIGRQA